MMATHVRWLASTNRSQTTSRTRGRGFASFAVTLAGGLALAGCATLKVPDIELYPGPKFAAGDEPSAVALSNVNGDGALDLAVANLRSDDVSVLLGKGDGSFQAEQRFAAGDRTVSVALGDVNGDRVLDLGVANADSDDVSVLLGKPPHK